MNFFLAEKHKSDNRFFFMNLFIFNFTLLVYPVKVDLFNITYKGSFFKNSPLANRFY